MSYTHAGKNSKTRSASSHCTANKLFQGSPLPGQQVGRYFVFRLRADRAFAEFVCLRTRGWPRPWRVTVLVAERKNRPLFSPAISFDRNQTVLFSGMTLAVLCTAAK